MRRIAAWVFALAGLCAPAMANVEIEVVRPESAPVAWLVADDRLPLITLAFGWRGGAATDPQDKAGLSAMMASLLDEGAGARDAQQFQEALADKAIALEFDAGQDMLGGTLRCLTPHLETCFALLRDALTAPRFDDDAIARAKARHMAGIRMRGQSPAALASDALAAALFPDHPYGRPVGGTAESIEHIKAEDLRAHHAAHLARDNLIVAAVGDIDAATLADALDGIFGALPARHRLTMPPEVVAQSGASRIHIPHPNPQTHIAFGKAGVAYDDPRFFAALVMNTILGGGNSASRLMEEIREKRGLAYGVYSAMPFYAHSAVWRGALASDKPDEALAIVRREMARIASDGVEAQTLADAKTYLTGAYALRFDSGAKIAGELRGIQLLRLGVDYVGRRNGFVEAVALDDIRAIARAMLDPDALIVATAGGANP